MEPASCSTCAAAKSSDSRLVASHAKGFTMLGGAVQDVEAPPEDVDAFCAIEGEGAGHH